MKDEYPKLARGAIEKYQKSLPKSEREQIEKYMVYRRGRGLNDSQTFNNTLRMILHIRYMLEKPIINITLEELRKILSIINSSELSNHYRNNLKVNLKNYLKFSIPEWSLKFQNLEDIRTNGIGQKNEARINHKTLLTKEDIEKLVKAELSLRWRSFLLLQYEAGLRTIEVRNLKWDDIKLDVEDGLTEVNIYSTKTKKSRTVYVKEATHYIKLYLQEQTNTDDKGLYIFHMKHDKNRPISKFSVNDWFGKLCKKVLNREGWNYLLRHSRASHLYQLSKENKISKDTAIKFMGHSEDMSKTYDHPNPNDIKKMLREQVYQLEDLPPEKKHKLERQLAEQKKEWSTKFRELQERVNNILKEHEEKEKEILATIK